jgi:predicted outer membrane repeat protein
MKTRAKILAALFVALLMAPTVTGEVIFVDADARGNNDGTSWADAFNDLQDALIVASGGDEIRVAQGIYKPDQGVEITPGDRTATFQLKDGVIIKGGFAGFGEPDPNTRDIDLYETILCGDIGIAGYWPDNCYHVVTANGVDETAVLDGFTITCGLANIGHNLQGNGGGMLNKSSNPTVINCTFIGNSAIEGGGMANLNSNPMLTNCNFIGNRADMGAGLCNGYDSNPTLTNCTFSGNSVEFDGGGMANYVRSSPTLTNCTFTGNSASYGGGMDNSDCKPSMRNCIFSGNSADYGGGICNWESSPRMTNCIFSGNRAKLSGGGIYVRVGFSGPGGGCYMINFCNITLINCIFVDNLAENGRFLACASCDNKFPSKVQISNCILWNGGDEIRNYDGTTITITYSDIWGGFTGEGNIDTDPCFVDPGYRDASGGWFDGDYHLLPDSPCIDAGDPNYVAEPDETDLDGKPRVIGGRIDMGAYEYSPPMPAEARIIPRTLNLASEGRWITCYIRLPDDYNVSDIDNNSVLLEDAVQAASLLVDEQKQVATARFNREEVQGILDAGEVELAITGRLIDGILFEARDVIRVIYKGGAKK